MDKAVVNSLAKHGVSLFSRDDLLAERYGAFIRALMDKDEELYMAVRDKVREHLHRQMEEASRRLDRIIIKRMDWPDVIPG